MTHCDDYILFYVSVEKDTPINFDTLEEAVAFAKDSKSWGRIGFTDCVDGVHKGGDTHFSTNFEIDLENIKNRLERGDYGFE